MNVLYAPEDSYIGRLTHNLHANEGKHPISIDFTEEEYLALKKELGCPPNLQIPSLLNIAVTVDGKSSEAQGAGIIV